MTLYIDTSNNQVIRLELREEDQILARSEINAEYAQAEKLLPSVEGLVRTNGLDVLDIKKVIVENYGESFTALRIGVITANVLSYALHIPVFGARKAPAKREDAGLRGNIAIVKPVYNREPNITRRAER